MNIQSRMCPPPVRSIRRFAEAEIVMPSGGPCGGERYRCRTQKYSDLFLSEIEAAEKGLAPWTDFVSTGSTQSGKTVTCALIPMMYALFELKENVIFGVPTMKLARKKWLRDIKPIIMASRYAYLMPYRGPGSNEGSTVDILQFGNGACLIFMTSGGGREERSGDTARWMICTEADSFSAMDHAGGEGRKIDQLIARTHAFGDRRRVFAECTTTTEDSFVWDTYAKGSSRSEVVSQCHACLEWIRPEREHLVGWQDAKTELESAKIARWMCPKCGLLFGESERQEMTSLSRLIHKGQTIGTDGAIAGALPETTTLGFRWNAFDNRLCWTTGFIARTEFKASKGKDSEAASVSVGQFYWTRPREADAVDLIELDAEKIQKRVVSRWTKGQIPADAELVTMGEDIGKRNLHWTLLAHRPNGCVHVCDYGAEPVPFDTMELGYALRYAMLRLAERVKQGWEVHGSTVRVMPEQVFVDSGWGDYADLVYQVCRELGVRYRAIKGFGFGQGKGFGDTSYTPPNKTSHLVKMVGNGWHMVDLEEKDFELIHISANYWKTKLQTSIVSEAESPGSFTLFDGTDGDHAEFKKHLCSEKSRIKQRFDTMSGTWDIKEVWERVHKQNHYLDATCYGLTAADFVRLVRAARAAPVQSAQTPAAGLTTPDGRPFFVGARA